MWVLDYKESRVPKNWCFWTAVLEKTLESPLDCKEIKPVHPKGDQSWVFIGRTDAEAETPVLWPPDVKSWLIRKDPDAGKDWRQEKGMTKDETVGWYHGLDGHYVWVSSRSWWWTGKPGVLQSTGLQRVGQNWPTESNWATAYMTSQGHQRRINPDIKPLPWAEDDTARRWHVVGRKSSKARFCPWRANSTVKQTKHKEGDIRHQLKVKWQGTEFLEISTGLKE